MEEQDGITAAAIDNVHLLAGDVHGGHCVPPGGSSRAGSEFLPRLTVVANRQGDECVTPMHIDRGRRHLREDRGLMGAHLRIRPRLPRSFRRLLGSAWVSNTGDGVRNAALPLIAASLTTSASTVTIIAAAGTLPFTLFGVVAGTMADRNDRVPLIVRAHLFRAVVGAALAAMLFADEMTVTLLAAGAFLLGCGEALADSAAPALVPDLVDDEELERANSELETAELVANDLIGPPVGGLLYATASAVPFALDAVSFASSAAMVRSIDGSTERPDAIETRSWREDLAEGITTAWTNRVLRSTGLLVVILQVGNLAAIAPIVLYVTDRLGVAPAAYGIFLAVGSVGGIAGSRIAQPAIRRHGSYTTLIAAIVVSILSFLVMTIAWVPAVALGFATSFGAVVVGRIVVITARQRSVPSRLLGRAQGAMRTMVWGAATVGALLGGVLADAVGDRAPFVFAAACYVVGGAVSARSLKQVLVDPQRR
ncbi:MFS transporter [Actinospongicola halichondriae]|uniref:MFS transporter n=1 Tax=Actinospongicola halichondriae TaxID=3236844 RepID=UPI003D54A3CB